MRELWGSQIAYVSQDPSSALNPSLRVGEQLAEILQFHLGLSGEPLRDRVLALLRMVKLPNPQSVANRYPHQLSGGMQQRALIAMALSLKPRLVIFDEPTSNLDTTTQVAVLDLVRSLIRDQHMAALFVTHNLGLVAQICSQVVVLYAGEIVEYGPAQAIFRKPLNPYTAGLLTAVPRLGDTRKGIRLPVMGGRIPDLDQLPTGCIFKVRCPLAAPICEEHPHLYLLEEHRLTRCHRWEELQVGELWPKGSEDISFKEVGEGELLSVERVSVTYPRSGNARMDLTAVKMMDLHIPVGRTVGLVGESGSGKTTLARAIVGLVQKSDGVIRLKDVPLPSNIDQRSMEELREIQMVFQNSDEALNPHQTVGQILRRSFQVMHADTRPGIEAQVIALLEAVQLSAEYIHRTPRQLSGGERQRVAIARAIVSHPSLLIADEAVSSLDASVQTAVLNLFLDLQAALGGAILFISHDLAAVGYVADWIAVIYAGQLMEFASSDGLFELPHHPYTHALLSSVLQVDPKKIGELVQLEDAPRTGPAHRGCPFHPRCPFSLGQVCAEQEPPWRELRTGKRYYCHLSEEELLEHESAGQGD
jgi:peptide/nickel transport system ATP-binding protein